MDCSFFIFLYFSICSLLFSLQFYSKQFHILVLDQTGSSTELDYYVAYVFRAPK